MTSPNTTPQPSQPKPFTLADAQKIVRAANACGFRWRQWPSSIAIYTADDSYVGAVAVSDRGEIVQSGRCRWTRADLAKLAELNKAVAR